MSLVDSPEAEYYQEGRPPEQEPSFIEKYWARIVIATLAFCVVGGLVIVSLPDSPANPTNASGIVSGQFVNEAGTPVPDIYVYVEGSAFSTTTDQTGVFTIEEVRPGSTYLVAGETPNPPEFIPLDVEGNVPTDAGTIVWPLQ